MIRSFLTATLLATTALPAAAQVPAGNSAPQPVPIVDTIPEAKDVRFPGTLKVNVDATDTTRGIFRVTETIPVPAAGHMVLLEKPDEVTEALTSLLRRVGAGTPAAR